MSSVVADLQAQGLVVERPEEPTRRRGARAPAGHARLDPSAGVAVGVDFGHRHLRVAVADLSSTVLAERSAALDVDHAAEMSLDTAVRMVAEVLEEAGVRRDAVIGAGMGLPGPIDARTGTLGTSVILPGWAGAGRRRRAVAAAGDARRGLQRREPRRPGRGVLRRRARPR